MERFSNLTKVPNEPAAKLMALANMKLQTQLEAPASAPIDAVLSELANRDAGLDLLRVMAAILPARERIWWSCLAARDIVGTEPENETKCLKAAETWVFRPTDEHREDAIMSLEQADPDDLTVHCAMGVMYCDGKLGLGDLAQMDAPPGAGQIVAFAMNVEALAHNKDIWDAHLDVLVDRALDIARGGSGKGTKGVG
ncbi:hypothetical protein MWU54_04585 [Marivita sp. S6314]|uniref:DUF6931 family protein n=1 Tax=Marivita sp. S6314 TaxID=2926406 RepID=UPI001FF4D663|nr:hypothetical protein [Marivita sp. S6314]MCK0149288.1 hypothetical protein [Marivita sp. S6314]